MANEQNLKPFKKNDPETGEKDKRINRKGRAIRGFDALRKEWQEIFSEIMYNDKGEPIMDEVTGRKLTRLKARMRIATSSRNHQEFRTALEYAYGKPVEKVDVTSGGEKIKAYITISPDDWDDGKTSDV